MAKSKSRKHVPEIPVIGDVDEWEADTIKSLLEVPEGGEVVFYMDSAGGSVYGALAVVSMLRLRKLKATAVVVGECSSAALLVFGACQKRYVTPYSIFFFHRMRWQSDKRVGSDEAELWARHFAKMETEVDELQARFFEPVRDKLQEWIRQGHYLTGRDVANAGLAELVEI
jgi:ATP-dependent protease ClpP protease subunit